MSETAKPLKTFFLQKWWQIIIDTIWPPHSLMSAQHIDIDGTVESENWLKLKFHFGPQCAICANPMIDAHGMHDICPICIQDPPNFDKARAPILYDENSKQLVLALKHQGRKDGIKTFAVWMSECLKNEEIDLLIPVPLHRMRLFERGFNQSAWLAHEISKLKNIPWNPFILRRHKNTKSQNGLSIKGRMRNVTAAFSVKGDIKGKNICLIDDVFTTGSTVGACAKALKKAGAKSVFVLCLLRVGRAQSIEEFEMEIMNATI